MQKVLQHCSELQIVHYIVWYFSSSDTEKLASQMDDKFKKQFPTRKELEIVSSTREWKKKDNAAKTIQRFFLKHVKGIDIDNRIDIHTQTLTKRAAGTAALTSIASVGMPVGSITSRRGSYNPIINTNTIINKHEEVKRMADWSGGGKHDDGDGMLHNGDDYDAEAGRGGGGGDGYDVSPDEHITRTLYQESDIDWKTHSLPSLGRASSDNTLGSASGLGDADCYAIRKSVSRANKNKKSMGEGGGGGNNRRAHSMIMTDEELEDDEEVEEMEEDEMEDRFNDYNDAPDLPGTVSQVPSNINFPPNRDQETSRGRRRQPSSTNYEESDTRKKYNQNQNRSRPRHNKPDKDERTRGKRYNDHKNSNYRNKPMLSKEFIDDGEPNKSDKWGDDDTLYWGHEDHDSQEYQKQIKGVKAIGDGATAIQSGKIDGVWNQMHGKQQAKFRDRKAPNVNAANFSSTDKGRANIPSTFTARPPAAFPCKQEFIPVLRGATLPAIPTHQPPRLLPQCPVRQVLTERGQTAVVPRRKLPQVPIKASYFDQAKALFRHSVNIDTSQNSTSTMDDGGFEQVRPPHHQSNPDINYGALLPITQLPQPLTARQLPTAPVLGARRTFSFNQALYGDEIGRRSPIHRFSYHEAMRGGRVSAVPFASITASSSGGTQQVQFQDQFSSLPRDGKISQIQRYHSLQGSSITNYSGAASRTAAAGGYDQRRLSFHDQGRVLHGVTTLPNKRFSLRGTDNRSSLHEANMAALHVVGNKQGFHYHSPANIAKAAAAPQRHSRQFINTYSNMICPPDEPSPPPAVANLTPSETATEPDYDLYDAHPSNDDELMQDQYEQDSSVFNPDDETTNFGQVIQDTAPTASGRQTSMRQSYKRTKPHWQDEDEIERRQRLRQNLQKQISEEATGGKMTGTLFGGPILSKQVSCEYHGGGATSLDLDYEYEEPEHIEFYQMEDDNDPYEQQEQQYQEHSTYDTKQQRTAVEEGEIPYEGLHRGEYGYNRQTETAEIDLETSYRQAPRIRRHDNETEDEYASRMYAIPDLDVRGNNERSIGQELSEAYVEECHYADIEYLPFGEASDYEKSGRSRAAVGYHQEGASAAAAYYYDDDQRRQTLDEPPTDRQIYRHEEEGQSYKSHTEEDKMMYSQKQGANVHLYYDEESEQRYRDDERMQMYTPQEETYGDNRQQYEYAYDAAAGREKSRSATTNKDRERQMEDIVEDSNSQPYTPSEEDQQYMDFEHADRLRKHKEEDEDDLLSPPSPRRRRRNTEDYHQDAELQPTYKSKVKKGGVQKKRSSKSSRPEQHDDQQLKASRRHTTKEKHQHQIDKTDEEPQDSQGPLTSSSEKKSKSGKARKGDSKSRKSDKRIVETVETNPDTKDSQQQHSARKQTRHSSSSASRQHTDESRNEQRRHQSSSQNEEQQPDPDNETQRSSSNRRQRQSIRRQRPVDQTSSSAVPEAPHEHGPSSARTGGGICEEMVEVDDAVCFDADEASQFHLDRDGGGGGGGNRTSSGNTMKYMDDRTNCRKK